MSTGTVSTPLMVLFLLPPMFNDMNNTVARLAKFVPTTSMSDMIDAAVQGQSILSGEFLSGFVVIIAWTLLGAAAFIFMYKKHRMDN